MLRLLPTLLLLLALPCLALAQAPPDTPSGEEEPPEEAEQPDPYSLKLTPGVDEQGRAVAAGPGRPLVALDPTVRLISPKGTAELLPIARGERSFLGSLTLAAFAAVPTHRDPVEEFLVLSEGGGIHSIDGGTWEICVGDAVWMGAGAQVTYVNGAEPTTVLQAWGGPGPAEKYESWTAGSAGTLVPAEARSSFKASDTPTRSSREAPAVAGPGSPVVHVERLATWTGGGTTELLKLADGRDASLGTYWIHAGERFPLVPEGTQELLVLATGPASLELDGLSRDLDEGQQVGLYVGSGSRASIETASRVEVTVLRAGPDTASAWAPWTPAFDRFLDSQREQLLGRLNDLRTAELAYQAEADGFMSTPPCPPGNPGAWPRPWEGQCTEKFQALGWVSDVTETYCTYQVRLIREGGNLDFEATATCDLDGDGRFSRYKATSSQPAHRVSAVDVR